MVKLKVAAGSTCGWMFEYHAFAQYWSSVCDILESQAKQTSSDEKDLEAKVVKPVEEFLENVLDNLATLREGGNYANLSVDATNNNSYYDQIAAISQNYIESIIKKTEYQTDKNYNSIILLGYFGQRGADCTVFLHRGIEQLKKDGKNSLADVVTDFAFILQEMISNVEVTYTNKRHASWRGKVKPKKS